MKNERDRRRQCQTRNMILRNRSIDWVGKKGRTSVLDNNGIYKCAIYLSLPASKQAKCEMQQLSQRVEVACIDRDRSSPILPSLLCTLTTCKKTSTQLVLSLQADSGKLVQCFWSPANSTYPLKLACTCLVVVLLAADVPGVLLHILRTYIERYQPECSTKLVANCL